MVSDKMNIVKTNHLIRPQLLGSCAEGESVDNIYATIYTQKQLEQAREMMLPGDSQVNLIDISTRERIMTALKPPLKDSATVFVNFM